MDESVFVTSSNTVAITMGFTAVLAVLVTRASQSKQHGSIHIESCKSPTAKLFDVDSERISIIIVNTKEYHSDVLARSQG
ncbi:hypothetical protein Tco_0571273 [Tanacetum coccineum]